MLRPGEISGRVFPCPPAVPESSLGSGLSSLVDDEQGPCLRLGLTRSARESAGLELTAPEGYPVGPKGGAWRQHRTHAGPWDSSLFLGCWLGGSVCRGARSQASPGGAGTRCSPWSGGLWSRGSYGEEGPGVSLGMGVRRGAGRSAVPSRPHLVMANSSLRALSTRGQALCGHCIGQFSLHLPSLTRWVAHFAAEELRPRPGKKAARLQLYVSRRQTPLRGTGPALGSRPTEEGLPHSLALLRMPWSSRVAPAGPTKPDSAPSQGQEVSSAGFTAQVL